MSVRFGPDLQHWNEGLYASPTISDACRHPVYVRAGACVLTDAQPTSSSHVPLKKITLTYILFLLFFILAIFGLSRALIPFLLFVSRFSYSLCFFLRLAFISIHTYSSIFYLIVIRDVAVVLWFRL